MVAWVSCQQVDCAKELTKEKKKNSKKGGRRENLIPEIHAYSALVEGPFPVLER